MKSWLSAMAKTRSVLSSALKSITGKPDEEALEDLEEALIRADVPVSLVAEFIDQVEDGRNSDPAGLLKELILGSMRESEPDSLSGDEKPTVILIVGVNGSGKTTSAAKLAARYMNNGLVPLLGAADTFRAAGSDQLKLWADRIGCDAVGGAMGSDPAAVAYDAAQAAKARGADVLIVDTAGRMHTRKTLMAELQKIQRSLGQCVPGAPHETWLVLDASIGGNALNQAEVFHEASGVTGIIISKLDGSAKGGFLAGVSSRFNLPVLYAGLGEGQDDLAPFDREQFVDSLLAVGEDK